jgi:hypothetical protein
MKLSITIEVDDRLPNEEFCGIGCKGLGKGICHMFNIQLEDNSHNKIDNFNGQKITYDKTSVISEWKRCQQCIDMFYQFCDTKK